MDCDIISSFQRFCRVCMASSGTEDFPAELYSHQPSSNQPTLGSMLGIICASVFSDEPVHPHGTGMPLRVCQPCEQAIVDAYTLHQLCVETDRKLKELLVVKQEPLVDEKGFFEEIVVDPILHCEVSESGVKIEKQEDGESMSDSGQSTSKIRTRLKRTSPRKQRIATALKKHMIETNCKIEDNSSKKPDRKNQRRVRAACEYCQERFDSYIRLKKHLEENHPERVQRCEICNKTFLDEAQYEDHRQFHITGKRFACRICGKRFKLNKSLEGHMSTHNNVEPSPCPECGKLFKNVDSLRNHIRRHNKQPKIYPCKQCPVKTNSMAKMRSHMLTHTKEKNHVCESCGSSFTVAFSLKMHMKHVHGERNYPCKLCSIKFSSSKSLIRHMRTHTGEKPYKCAYCDRAYAQSNDLLKHSRIHVGDTPYACDRCSESFRFVADLRNHYKVHFSDADNAEADATGAIFGGIANKAIFSIAEILKRRFEAEQQQLQLSNE